MSSMLEQAIIDAQALREAAIKSAEQAVIEKYSFNIKEAVEKLLEENEYEEEKTIDEQISDADEKGKGYSFVENTDLSDLEQNDLVEIDVKALFEEMIKEKKDEPDDDYEPDDDDDNETVELDESLFEEELELSEELEEAIKFDYKPVPVGQTRAYGATNAQKEEESLLIDVMAAIEEENMKLEKKNESLVKKNSELKESNLKLKSTVNGLAEKFEQIKLMNSKLFYTNKTLMDASLNERQKNNLVESINNAQSSEQAKIVYETLKSTVGNVFTKKQPESLSEAVGKRSSTSLLLKARKSEDEKKQTSDIKENVFAERMQILAGIK